MEERKLIKNVLAVYGSPRVDGNSALLLDEAVAGAREAGCHVEQIVLRDLALSPCLEIYGCRKTGRCAIQDDFQRLYDLISECDGMMLASPVFFYAVSSHVKIVMDRCQSFWVRKNWLSDTLEPLADRQRPGLFIGVGATRGKKLFDGILLSVRYFFEAIDVELMEKVLFRQLDFKGDVLLQPLFLEQARTAGRRFGHRVMEA